MDFKGYTLHDYQENTIDRVLQFASSDSKRLLIASPTGTGKSIMELKVLSTLPNSWMITPRVEIICDMMAKMGLQFATQKEALDKAWKYRITTPIKFKNQLLAGYNCEPDYLLKDEAHHDEAQSWNDIDTMLPDHTRYIGFTASPYRGRPKETAEFLAKWGEPYWSITYFDAMTRGFISMPSCRTVPLVDDDLITLNSSGQFEITEVISNTECKLTDALQIAKPWFNASGKPNKPTLISVPSSKLFTQMAEVASTLNINLNFISQATTYEQRKRMLAECRDAKVALVHIDVISEGVDLPIRNHLDLAPCFSPVKFIQRFGRGTRPGDKGEYICTNRNLERHGYLLNGCVPLAQIRQAQLAFEKPTERSGVRAFGLTSLGKLRDFKVKLVDGLTLNCYNVTQMNENNKTEYIVILHPSYGNPFWFCKTSPKVGDQMQWGKWETIEAPSKLEGFNSAKPYSLTPNQQKMWDNNAEKHGLCKLQPINAKIFQIVAVLKDVKVTL